MENVAEMAGDASMASPGGRGPGPEGHGELVNEQAQAALDEMRARPSIGEAAIRDLASKVAKQGEDLARGLDSYAGVDLGAASWADIAAVDALASEAIAKSVGKRRIEADVGKVLFDDSAPGHDGAEFPENAFAIKVALSAKGVHGGGNEATVAEMQVWMRDDWEFHGFLSQFDGQAEGWGSSPEPASKKQGPKDGSGMESMGAI